METKIYSYFYEIEVTTRIGYSYEPIFYKFAGIFEFNEPVNNILLNKELSKFIQQSTSNSEYHVSKLEFLHILDKENYES